MSFDIEKARENAREIFSRPVFPSFPSWAIDLERARLRATQNCLTPVKITLSELHFKELKRYIEEVETVKRAWGLWNKMDEAGERLKAQGVPFIVTMWGIPVEIGDTNAVLTKEQVQ